MRARSAKQGAERRKNSRKQRKEREREAGEGRGRESSEHGSRNEQTQKTFAGGSMRGEMKASSEKRKILRDKAARSKAERGARHEKHTKQTWTMNDHNHCKSTFTKVHTEKALHIPSIVIQNRASSPCSVCSFGLAYPGLTSPVANCSRAAIRVLRGGWDYCDVSDTHHGHSFYPGPHDAA